MEYEFEVSGKRFKIDIHPEGENFLIDVGSGQDCVNAQAISDHCLSLIVDGRSYKVSLATNEKKTYMHIDGHHFCLDEVEGTAGMGYARGVGITAGEQSVSAPMPGTVVTIQVQEGDEVEKNQCLVIVESMKMENALRSPIEGRVKKIHYKDGDLVDAGVPIIEITPLEGTG